MATFIDTSYILALVNTADEHHEMAAVAASMPLAPFITTEAIVVEIGNALARLRWRPLAIATIDELRSAPDTEIVTVDTSLLERSLQLYRQRDDKEWGLTDCISFTVMSDRHVVQVLTTDHHFTQAGFRNVLFG